MISVSYSRIRSSSGPCLDHGLCQTGFTIKEFPCKCLPGFPGTSCRRGAGTCMQPFSPKFVLIMHF